MKCGKLWLQSIAWFCSKLNHVHTLAQTHAAARVLSWMNHPLWFMLRPWCNAYYLCTKPHTLLIQSLSLELLLCLVLPNSHNISSHCNEFLLPADYLVASFLLTGKHPILTCFNDKFCTCIPFSDCLVLFALAMTHACPDAIAASRRVLKHAPLHVLRSGKKNFTAIC